MSSNCVPAAGLVVFDEDDIVLLLDFDDGVEDELEVLFVFLLELEDEVDCACSPGADIVRHSAAAAKRAKNLL